MVALLGSALADPEEPFSAEMEEVAGTATECLKNVLISASGSMEDGNFSESKVCSLLDHQTVLSFFHVLRVLLKSLNMRDRISELRRKMI